MISRIIFFISYINYILEYIISCIDGGLLVRPNTSDGDSIMMLSPSISTGISFSRKILKIVLCFETKIDKFIELESGFI